MLFKLKHLSGPLGEFGVMGRMRLIFFFFFTILYAKPPVGPDLRRNTTTKRVEKNLTTARVRGLRRMLDRLTITVVTGQTRYPNYENI